MKGHFTKLLALVALVASTARAESPDPGLVNVNSISYAGTGCPAGSVAGNISEDARAFTVLFDAYTAEAGPGLALREGRKACVLNIDLHIPQGWQYSILTVDTRGFLNLERGTSAFQQNKYYFQGDLRSSTKRSDFYGPLVKDYTVRDLIGIESLVWSPCGVNRSLNVATSAGVMANSGRRALATVDSIDGEFKLIYGINWRHCQ